MDYFFYQKQKVLESNLKPKMSDKISLELDESNRVEIYLHGATLTSWVSNNKEILFVSSKSVFDNKKAIRGGIPIVFPNFGPWELGPQHGFARIKRWNVKEPVRKSDESVSVQLCLFDDEETRKQWNHKFELVYEVVLRKDSLKTYLTIKNLGPDEFDFTTLLHTYFKVDDIRNVKIQNLNGLKYVDKVKNGDKNEETRESITISEETDRIYISATDNHIIDTGNGLITIHKENLPDTVVWNPWIEKSKSMSDFGDEEYNVMVCVEAGLVNRRHILKPNEEIKVGQTLSI